MIYVDKVQIHRWIEMFDRSPGDFRDYLVALRGQADVYELDRCSATNGAIDSVFESVEAELRRALVEYDHMPTAHDGVSVLREEFEELWEQVKIKDSKRDKLKMREEATQVAAMAIRFILDVCEKP